MLIFDQVKKGDRHLRLVALAVAGGSDWRSLYVTAGTGVYRMRVRVPGLPVPATFGAQR